MTHYGSKPWILHVIAAMALSTVLVFLFPTLLIASPNGGQNAASGAGSKQKAKEFFKRGKELFGDGQFKEAAKSFEKAYAIMPNQAVLANIALCLDKAGDVPGAVEAYRRYLESPIDNQPNAKMRSQLKELETLVGEVFAICSMQGCDIHIDKVSKKTDSGLFAVLPGTYVVEGVVEGRIISQEQVSVKKGGRVTVRLFERTVAQKTDNKPDPVAEPEQEPVVEPGPEPMAEPEEEPVLETEEKPMTLNASDDLSDRKSKFGAPFWYAASFTVVSGVVAGALGGASLSQYRSFVDSGRTDQTLAKKGKNMKIGSNVAIAVSGTAAALTLVFAIVDLKKGNKKQEKKTVSLGEGPGIGAGIYVRF